MNVEFIHGDPSWPQFKDFFGGFLAEHDGRIFLVDCGVGSGAESMIRRLKERLGRRPVDYVLMTHIHLDHAGGLKAVLETWPAAKVVVHAKGLRHLVSPERLWIGTQKVMGQLADMYGRPDPLDESYFIPHTQADIPGLKVFVTPGHAPHHLSFRLGRTMFVGEAGGCPAVIGGRVYMRPATPSPYRAEDTLASIELLLKEPDEFAYFGHCHELLPYRENLLLCRTQLALWDEILRRPSSARREGEEWPPYLDRLYDALIAEDPYFPPLSEMDDDDRWRERYQGRGCIVGFLEYYSGN